MSEPKINKQNEEVNSDALIPIPNNSAYLMSPEEIKRWRMNLENFQRLLHRKPRKIEHRQGIPYVPIDAVQKALDELFFGLWKWEVLFEPKLIVNEIMICGRLHYFHPVAQTWLFRDGVACAQVRFKEKTDWTIVSNKIQNTLEMDVPHAEADALKSAAGKIGDKFGRNIRRKIKDDFQGIYGEEVETLTKEQDSIYMNLCVVIGTYEKAEELRKDTSSILEKAKGKLPKSHLDKLEEEIQTQYNKLKGKK